MTIDKSFPLDWVMDTDTKFMH